MGWKFFWRKISKNGEQKNNLQWNCINTELNKKEHIFGKINLFACFFIKYVVYYLA